jgi:integrase
MAGFGVSINGWFWVSTEAGVRVRWHDLRHTACTRLLEAGVSLPIVARILGWSASTTVRMAQRYGHIGPAAQREAMAMLVAPSQLGARAGDQTRDNRLH